MCRSARLCRKKHADMLAYSAARAHVLQHTQTSTYLRARDVLQLERVLADSKETSKEEVEQRRKKLRERLPPEPEEGSASIAKICFQYNDQRIWRRFDADDTVGTLFSYVASHEVRGYGYGLR